MSFSEIIQNYIGSIENPELCYVIVSIFGIFLLKITIDFLRSCLGLNK